MKVLFDYQIFSLQHHGGVSRYFFELINQLVARKNIDVEVSVGYSDNLYLTQAEFKKTNVLSRHLRGEIRNSISRILNRRLSRVALHRNDYDIFHPTYYRTYFLNLVGRKPFVLTIYDMTHELFPNAFPYRQQAVAQQKAILAKRAAKIIAISESTKRDVVRILGVPDSKVEVIHLASSMSASLAFANTMNLPLKYLLFVGHRWGYKNFELFVRAVTPLLLSDEALKVVCVGGGPFTARERQLFTSLRISGKLSNYSLSDEVLSAAYNNAIAFVFPSLYEGFGLPILEAFSCSCPAIVSNSSSFPEVAGEGAKYFDPTDELSLRRTIVEVVNNIDLQRELKRKGYEQLKRFSWTRTASETEKLYRTVLQN